MLNKNKKGVILVEVLISIIILSVFYMGLFQFLDFQHKVWLLSNKDIFYDDLFQESKQIISLYDYDELSNGNYYLYYEIPSQFTSEGKYVFQSSPNDTTIYDGMKINSNGYKLDITSSEDYYIREIKIESLIYPFLKSGINMKKVCVNIKNKECLENCFEKCFYLIKDSKYYE